MAAEQQHTVATDPRMVGEAFVHQYYHILFHSPELVHRFYQDISKLGRPDGAGTLNSVSTMEAINEKILSSDSSEYQSEILTVDAQESYNSGVLILVTGHLTGKDNVKRSFTQTFFLAPQEKGYFVLNDIFRYTDATHHQQQVKNASTIAPESTPEQKTPSEGVEEEAVNVKVADKPSDTKEEPVAVEETPKSKTVDKAPQDSGTVVDSRLAGVQGEAPKKSYASIVKVLKENAVPSSAFAAPPARPAIIIPPENHSSAAPTGTSEAPASGSHATENTDVRESEADVCSVYIKNLPLNATPAQLEEEFKRFGPIKSGGIQVRSNKQQGFCFGFVEFEVASAVQQAIEASPVLIGGRQAYVEEKRPAGSRPSSRGRHLPGRGGGFRGDGMRGRGGYYGNGRGYGRGDYSGRSDISAGWGGGGRGGRGDATYQRVDNAAGSHGSRASGGGLSVNSSFKEVAPGVSAPA
ncbi:unnamed protein product [Spirodela intermedia]|uniref:Uncharacterized protein n=1 Tax=Spirodela intermedia TaxID=51605 RepID=A0A7I8J2Q1_SPIIN|nr:unnamed protein product [Spirodela intermedia]CAA6664093.1 unnamed protein product [Spirodela intermedia]